jgi:hypothetical protein
MPIAGHKVGRAMVGSAMCALLGACAHSGVVKAGPDTYMIANSEWGFTSGGYQEAKAVDEGSKYCDSIGREILVLHSAQNDVSFGKTPAAEVRFRCLLKGDPELTRPPAP